MKTKLFIIIVGLFLCGCSDKGPPPKTEKYINEYHIVRIDGCQYLISHTGWYMSHKGNCDNPIHIYNKLNNTH